MSLLRSKAIARQVDNHPFLVRDSQNPSGSLLQANARYGGAVAPEMCVGADNLLRDQAVDLVGTTISKTLFASNFQGASCR